MKLERMIAIVMLLLQRKKVTAKELAQLFEVSLRTIYRDIETINAAGIPLVTTPGVGGGIGIIEQYKIEKGIFTTDDISTLLMGLGLVQGAISSKDAARVHAKLSSFISEEFAEAIAQKTDQILFDLSAWVGGKDSSDLRRILKASMERKHTLSFSYFSRNGAETLHGVEPHRLVFKNGQWYLQGYSATKQGFRLFKLRRMHTVRSEENIFYPRKLAHPFSDFTDQMGKKTVKIKLLVDCSAVDRILDYCTINDLSDAGDGNFIINFDFIPDDYGYGILMSFGNKLTCIEPPHIRTELQQRLKNALDQYREIYF